MYKMDTGTLKYHGADVACSSEPINFQFNQTYAEYVNAKSLFRVHSCLMIFAWMFCASTGILIAR